MKNYLLKNFAYIMMVFGPVVFMNSCQSGSENKNSDTVVNSSSEAPKVDIHTAVFSGNLDAVKQHIAAGSDLNVIEPLGGSSPLISAVVWNREEEALALIEAGADLDLKNKEGSTALHVAAFFGRTNIAEALVEKGADQTIKNNYGSTPLESVTPPFEQLKPIYDQLSRDLGPMGFRLDYDKLPNDLKEVRGILSGSSN